MPEIRYCRTADGISIAYMTMGAGRPLLITAPLGTSHIERELAFGELREWYERLARRRMVIRFDWRGNGSSQRDLPELPADWFTLDVEAVLGSLGLEATDVMGCGGPGDDAIQYAARFPERVQHLVLWAVPANRHWGSKQVAATGALWDQDYVAATEASAGAITGWSDPARAHAWAQFIRAAMNERDDRLFRRLTSGKSHATDATLSSVRCSTLVLHPARARNMPVENARYLAAAISGARLVVCTDADGLLPTSDQAVSAIEQFLDGSAAAAGPSPADDRLGGTAVILFTDVADSTALTERMGDAAFRTAERALDAGIRAAIREAGGSVVQGKVLGDGVMAFFTSGAAAIDGALRCLAISAEGELSLHIGVHAGDVIHEDNNVYGGAVNVAARICGLSQPGEVLVSATVRDLARTSAGVRFEERGEHVLKGISEPQRLFAVAPP